jgi:hypothetical protein
MMQFAQSMSDRVLRCMVPTTYRGNGENENGGNQCCPLHHRTAKCRPLHHRKQTADETYEGKPDNRRENLIPKKWYNSISTHNRTETNPARRAAPRRISFLCGHPYPWPFHWLPLGSLPKERMQ